jgi:hypothetical protein
MDKWMIDPKEVEDVKEPPKYTTYTNINRLVVFSIFCIILLIISIGYFVYSISNKYTLDDIKEKLTTWINRIRFNTHISNGTFYTEKYIKTNDD